MASSINTKTLDIVSGHSGGIYNTIDATGTADGLDIISSHKGTLFGGVFYLYGEAAQVDSGTLDFGYIQTGVFNRLDLTGVVDNLDVGYIKSGVYPGGTTLVEAEEEGEQHTKTFTVDGYVKEVKTKTFTTDGYVVVRSTETFTVDGYVVERFTETFTVDGIVSGTETETFTVDGYVVETTTETFTVDGYVVVRDTETFTADGYVVERFTETFTVDGLVSGTWTKDFTVDGFVALTTTKTFTVDGYVALTTTETFTVDGVVAERPVKTFTVDGLVAAEGQTKTFTVDGIVEAHLKKQFTADGIVSAPGTKTFGVDGIVDNADVPEYPSAEYANLPALGRFKPGPVDGGAGYGEIDVTLETNLAGEPIRFTLNETLDNIVSSGTLTMLNAIINDEGEQQIGVMGEVKTEEDEAKWGTLYDSAPVEPNQLCYVTEAGGGLGECTTYWRVVGVTSYLDENDVPYYEVQLEGLGQIAIDTKFDPSLIVNDIGTAWFLSRPWYDSQRELYQVDLDNDGYVDEEEVPDTVPPVVNPVVNGTRYIVESPSAWLQPFLDQIAAKGLDCGAGVTSAISTYPSLETPYKRGQTCWQIITDCLAFFGHIARFTRDKRMVVIDLLSEDGWAYMPTGVSEDGVPQYDQDDIDNPPLQDQDIGDFGQGLQLGYSKEGVYSQANVTGYLGKEDDDGNWIVDEDEPTGPVIVTSQAGLNVLNGEIVELTVNVDDAYRLEDESQLEMYGMKELYKSVVGARSATYDSDTVPLVVEVGMNVIGSSKLGGTTEIFVTALNRTTDAQQNTIQTGISGTRITEGAGGDENTMGWE